MVFANKGISVIELQPGDMITHRDGYETPVNAESIVIARHDLDRWLQDEKA